MQSTKWPKNGTLLYLVARFLTANARRFGGSVPLHEFFDRHPEIDRKQVFDCLHTLRKHYGYYCKKTSNPMVISCALDWSEVKAVQVWVDDSNYKIVHQPIPDPRMFQPEVRRRYPIPARGTILFDIYTYVLRHRKNGVVDITNLCGRWGSKRVHNKFDVLREKYGLKIEWVDTHIFRVTKLPNPVLASDR